MDVRLSAEQRALRSAATDLVDSLRPQSVIDLADADRAARLDAAVAASGWRTLRDADEGGAPYASAVEAAIVAEEMGRGLADAAFAGPVLAGELRRLAAATPAGKPETVAMAADLSDLGLAGRRATAIDAGGATVALLLAGGELVSIPLSGTAEPVDLTRPHCPIESTAVTTPVSASITTAAMARWTAFGLALTCADLVGVMRGAIALATDYAKIRKQYGAQIGSYQAVQHLLADAFVAMEGSRSAALHAAWAVDAMPVDDALAAAAGAKAFCARAGRAVCETAIQVHGGIGNTWDCLAHVYLRRALVSIDTLGGVGPSLDRVLLGARVVGTGHGLR
ncbi:MAG TPA: acyl-CoA dehydrogenase family protein [Mycobacteriales bacterium]|nr:acyl-CoA dehydrogenase family protein [Mycobacteriales bacterium]